MEDNSQNNKERLDLLEEIKDLSPMHYYMIIEIQEDKGPYTYKELKKFRDSIKQEFDLFEF